MKQSIKSIKAQVVNEVAQKYKRRIDALEIRNQELEAKCAKYKKEIAKLQASLESQRINKEK